MGFPAPTPSAAFSQPVGAPAREDVVAALRAIQTTANAIVHRDPVTGIVLPATDVDLFAPRGRLLAFYFSGHWCPPCRAFTPTLRDAYGALLGRSGASRAPLEIIYVSADRSEAEFTEYVAEMPWLALAYANEALRKAISDLFNVSAVPTLVVVDPADGSVVQVSVLLYTVTFYAIHAHSLTRSP